MNAVAFTLTPVPQPPRPPDPSGPTGWAFMGYAWHKRHGFSVRVCSWCPDSGAVEMWAKPMPVTHGICPTCYNLHVVGNAVKEYTAA